jgi:protein O-GlcNAc transferase
MRPTHVGALNLLGVVLMQLGQLAEAERFLRRALEQHGSSDVTLYNYGLILKSLGRSTEALERFTQALTINSHAAETWNSRGTVLNDLKRYQDAIGDFDKAVAINYRYADALYNKGKSLAMLKRFDEAISAYAAAIAIKPDLAEAWLGRGNIHLELRDYESATAAYEQALTLKPVLAEAYHGRARVFGETKRYEEALTAFDQALTLKPQLAEAWLGRGNICIKLKYYNDALTAYNAALQLNPELTDAWLACASIFIERKQYNNAIVACDRALAVRPDFAGAWLGRGRSYEGLARHDEALAAFDRAVALEPNSADPWYCRGIVLFRLKHYEEAFAALEQALALKPDFAEAWVGIGDLAWERKRHRKARAAFDQALAFNPDLASAWLGRGNVAYDIRYDEAFSGTDDDPIDPTEYADTMAAFDRALALEPNLAEAWLGRGNVLCADIKNYHEAQQAYDQALALKPDLAEAWLGRGNALLGLKNYPDAQLAYDRALAIKPYLAKAWFGRGRVFAALNQYAEAVVAFDRALALKSDLKYARGARLYAQLHVADWTNLDAEISAIGLAVKEQKSVIDPLVFSLISSSPSDQLTCAKRFVKDSISFPAMWSGEIYSHGRIRIGYVSADFRNHPVAQLIVGLFEHHNKSRFHTVGVSLGPENDSSLRRRIELALDEFIDVREMSDEGIARLIRHKEIDIVVDLMGFTSENRLDVLAKRAAPIQVNYLGYPGTMAASYIDYVIADQTIIPEEHFAFYSEKVVWLPESYQPNDAGQQISERKPTRFECRLPETAFVFCCFNNTVKILPEMFDIWMRLLAAREQSVLWLSGTNATARESLSTEVEKRGISSDRLIFADKIPLLADHLARLRNADLFLDTLPYNAHATASDALWAGVPVLTCLGSSFASRVAASLLRAVGLDELITHSLEDYETLAVELANDSDRLHALRERLARNRTTHPLFDSERFTRHIESAYTTMWDRYQRGKAPKAFVVNPIA